MKKILMISAVLVVALVALGVAGFAYAQSRFTDARAWMHGPDADWGPGDDWDHRGGMRGMHGGGFGGMYGGAYGDGEYGPMHEYMFSAMAEALGLSVEELEERQDAGETMWDIAESQGISEVAFGELMLEARSTALKQAVADGAISQEQADWMLDHMEEMWDADGFGPCHDGDFGGRWGGRGTGGRWNSIPSEANPET